MIQRLNGGPGTRIASSRYAFSDRGTDPDLAIRLEAARRFRQSMSGNDYGDRAMNSTTIKAQTTSIKDIMAGGVWRSRRVVAAVAIAAGLSLGTVGAAVPQADASIGWCMRCTAAQPILSESVKTSFDVYSIRGNMYASAR